MSEIDVQNAKQIRDPMDVLIEMELASDDVTLSYSGYSGSAKVADGELDEPTWPMRKLADLQGDGFPLDGSCVLYDSSTSPSQTNGKLGVRGNVGEAVTITITGNKSIASLFIFATGAESVTFGSTTTPIYNNVVTIPVGATSITITLNPASETTRIEISQIGAGAKFRITNENLIRATVSLRADLSIIDPTLPESEINIEAYQDTDISELVASIPEDTPITYSAGYEGDMSPVRKFYVTGQVTWADNVLTIQGVDAVHFLEQKTIYPVALGTVDDRHTIGYLGASMSRVQGLAACAILLSGVIEPLALRQMANDITDVVYRDTHAIVETQTTREILTNIMHYFHQEIPAVYFGTDRRASFFPTYVDAGRPLYRDKKEDIPRHNIKEDDCGDIKRQIDRSLTDIIATWTPVSYKEANGSEEFVVGSGDWLKYTGIFLNFDDYVVDFVVRTQGEGEAIASVDKMDDESWVASTVSLWEDRWRTGPKLFGPDLPQGWMTDLNADYYTQVMPWYASKGSQAQAKVWPRSVTEQTLNVEIKGSKLVISTEVLAVHGGGQGVSANIDLDWLKGTVETYGRDDEALLPRLELYPAGAINSLFEKSPITGSFTWKGDPRMQPRDVVEWERLDGTTTTITLENITLTHEGGGTMAEITYREGVV